MAVAVAVVEHLVVCAQKLTSTFSQTQLEAKKSWGARGNLYGEINSGR